MDKDIKQTLWSIVFIIVVMAVILNLKGCDQNFSLVGGDAESSGSSIGTGSTSGGGGDSSGTDTGIGDTCSAVWKSDTKLEIESDPTFWDKVIPTRVTGGQWECDGTCTTGNCVMNPVDNIPVDGYTDYNGEKPDCLCLDKEPGDCAFYDSNYGEGDDSIECGGNCDTGKCGVYTVNNDKWCKCLTDDPFECGLHITDGSNLENLDVVDDSCFGYCRDEQGYDLCNPNDLSEGYCELVIDSKDKWNCECVYDEQDDDCDMDNDGIDGNDEDVYVPDFEPEYVPKTGILWSSVKSWFSK